MRLSELVLGLDIRPGALSVAPGGVSGVVASHDPVITDLTEDSRAVTPGCLFIARRGEKADGRAFIPDALRAGAAAILTDDASAISGNVPVFACPTLPITTALLAERFFKTPSKSLCLLGVTGTNGKTTTTFLIKQILDALGVRCGLVGTVWINDGAATVPASMTTPSAIDLSRSLSKMLRNACGACAIEVSSHALHQHRVGALTFAAAAFTNLTGDHLDYHQTMDRYADAKAMLFDMLPPQAGAIVNAADPGHARMLRDCPARPFAVELLPGHAQSVHRSGLDRTTARVLGAGPSWMDLEFAGPLLRTPHAERWTLRVPLVGDFNAVNALQALCVVAAVFGPLGSGELTIPDMVEALSRIQPPPGRVEPVRCPTSPTNAPTVLVDYAHTDDALRNVLTAVRAALTRQGDSSARLWCVFGCGGDRDRTKRPRMGRLAAELADCVVVTSDNPRTEHPDAIIAQVLEGFPTGRPPTVVEPDRARAIHAAIAAADPADIVLIAGKGHEDYQITADPENPARTIKRHFDDREVAREALAARSSRPVAASVSAVRA